MINIVKNAKTLDLKAISGKVSVSSGDKIIITDSINGQSSQKLITKKVGHDLAIYEEGAQEPSAILEEYYNTPTAQLEGIDSTGLNTPYIASETGNSFSLLTGPLEAPAAGEAVAAASALGGGAGTTAGLSTMSMIGLGGLGVAGAAVAVGSAGGKGVSASSPAPVVAIPDTTSPTATIILSNTTLKAGDTSTVTITFSEAVKNFSNADLTVANGILSTLTTTNNITWIATFTPDNNIENTTNLITLANTYTDTAGNTGTNADSSNYVIDTLVPVITSDTTQSIDENIPSGTVIYTATATDGNSVTYNLSGADESLLSINSTTGAIRLFNIIDYETKSSYSFTIIATDSANNASEKAVALAINNLDEIAPTITSSTTASTINENTTAGQVVYTSISTDTTDIATGATIYSLKNTGDSNLLSINSTTGAVTLIANPDYEIKNNYNFTVIATDSANNASEKAVTLAINNLDEIAPTITSTTTAPAINENSGSGQVIYTATSTDTADIATVSTVYSLKSGSDTGLTINSSTGAVTLTANPDYETKNSYSFTVIATDQANNASEKAITLAINDKDEIAPNIPTLSLETDSGTINSDGKTNISTININGVEAGATWEYRVDLGSWINGNGISFTALEGGHDYQARQTDASGNISSIFADFFVTLDTSAPIAPTLALATDSGTINSDGITNISTINVVGLEGSSPWEYSIDGGSWLGGSGTSFNATNGIHTYTARQSDIAGNVSTQSSTVTITLDTAIPVVFSYASTVSSDENTPTSSVVYDVNANDASVVSYSFAGGADANLFNINPYTGEVTFKTSPDYEIPTDNGTDNTYNFTIRATDTAGNTADKAIQVNINNLTETSNSPTATILIGDTALKAGEATNVFIVFSKAVTNFSNDDVLVENGTLSALTTTDNITWSAIFTPQDNLEDTTNVITLNTNYTDLAGNTGTGATSGNYTVDTLAPVFTSATTQSVSENTLASNVIYTAAATGAVNYNLSGVDASFFTLDSNTGAIRFISSPDYENPVDAENNNSYHITVRATDSSGNTTDELITINVNNVDEIAPVFTSGTSASVLENTSTSTVVYTATATDTNTIAYTISGTDAALFDLNSTTGAVTFKTSPNYEAPSDNGGNNIYNFSIYATDMAGNITNQTVALSVTNSSEVILGQSVIDLGGSGKLIAPYQSGGNWYYFWDINGDGAAGGGDDVTHDFLDGIFTKNILGEIDGNLQNTNDTYRYANLNGVNVALPTIGDGNPFASDGYNVNFYTDYAKIFNGNTDPAGWSGEYIYYWTSTQGYYGHGTVTSNENFVTVLDDRTYLNVALQVL